jgi:hypothetical protein
MFPGVNGNQIQVGAGEELIARILKEGLMSLRGWRLTTVVISALALTMKSAHALEMPQKHIVHRAMKIGDAADRRRIA